MNASDFLELPYFNRPHNFGTKSPIELKQKKKKSKAKISQFLIMLVSPFW